MIKFFSATCTSLGDFPTKSKENLSSKFWLKQKKMTEISLLESDTSFAFYLQLCCQQLEEVLFGTGWQIAADYFP